MSRFRMPKTIEERIGEALGIENYVLQPLYSDINVSKLGVKCATVLNNPKSLQKDQKNALVGLIYEYFVNVLPPQSERIDVFEFALAAENVLKDYPKATIKGDWGNVTWVKLLEKNRDLFRVSKGCCGSRTAIYMNKTALTSSDLI